MPNTHGNAIAQPSPRRVHILCIGNEYLADDAVGWAVHQKLELEGLPENVRLSWASLRGVDLLDELQGEALLILVDAMQQGEAPGTIRIFEGPALPAAKLAPVSAHGLSIEHVLSLGRHLFPEKVPQRTLLIAIEGREFSELGAALSPEVQATVEPVCTMIRNIISRYEQTQ